MNIGMIFGIIFAIIVIFFVTAFALPMILETGCAQEQLQVSDALNDLENTIGNFYLLSQGSASFYEFNAPPNVKTCFVYYNNPATNVGGGWTEPEIVRKTIIQENEYNVWFSYCEGEDGRHIEHLSVEDGKSFCITGSGRLYLENMGNHVKISAA